MSHLKICEPRVSVFRFPSVAKVFNLVYLIVSLRETSLPPQPHKCTSAEQQEEPSFQVFISLKGEAGQLAGLAPLIPACSNSSVYLLMRICRVVGLLSDQQTQTGGERALSHKNGFLWKHSKGSPHSA